MTSLERKCRIQDQILSRIIWHYIVSYYYWNLIGKKTSLHIQSTAQWAIRKNQYNHRLVGKNIHAKCDHAHKEMDTGGDDY